jgi:PAS domain-containing protein
VPLYICPNCKQRSVDIDGIEGFADAPVSCHHCGFGFLFELLEDYYPGPNTGFVVCDQQARVLAVGHGVFELTGYEEKDLLGRELHESPLVLRPDSTNGQDPVAVALEWGVRKLGEKAAIRTSSGHDKQVVADFFPAYDEDGGLLVALSPA